LLLQNDKQYKQKMLAWISPSPAAIKKVV